MVMQTKYNNMFPNLILTSLWILLVWISLLTDPAYGLPKQYEDTTPHRNCTTKRLEAIQQSRKIAEKTPGTSPTNSTGVMIPRCKDDGQYEEVQCHPSTDHCWCVESDTGTAIPSTAMQFTKPNCGEGDGEDSLSDMKCTDTDRGLFNSNLMSKFSSAYDSISAEERLKSIAVATGDFQGMTEENSKIAIWKFNSLDMDGDKQLTSQELRELKRDVRKNVRPKSCSKIFVSYCDKDSDSIVTEQEWAFCLGGKTDLPFKVFQSLSAMGPQDQLRGWSGDVLPIQDQSQSSDRKGDRSSPELMEHQKRLFQMLSGESSKDKDEESNRQRNTKQFGGNDRIDRSPDQILDNRKLVSLTTKTCMDERKSALAKTNEQTFVPSCQADGKYEATQCHTFSGYCWCVDEESGLPISGTSRLKEYPECDSIPDERVTSSFTPLSRLNVNEGSKSGKSGGRKSGSSRKKLKEIPGCPSPNHGAFLTQLVDLLSKEMASAGGALPPQLTNSANMSLEEKAIRWKAITADKNNDQKLSKREMRFIRHMVKEKKIKAPEKCAKKFMRYCDIDRDDYLTVNELLICTEVRKKARRNQRKQQSGGENIRHGSNRNPFTDLLKPSS